jgi:hypothetical protein
MPFYDSFFFFLEQNQGEQIAKALKGCFPWSDNNSPAAEEAQVDKESDSMEDKEGNSKVVEKPFGRLAAVLQFGLSDRLSAMKQTWEVVQHPSK